jgi:REP element-mobilizing transposase RayT
MPKLLKCYYGANDLHYITCSCYKRRPLLNTAPRRDLFLTVLEQVGKRYRLVVLGYVVMPEHFHLLITEPQKGNPSTAMQVLKLGFARRVLAEMARAQVSKTARPGAPSEDEGHDDVPRGVATGRVRCSRGYYPSASSVSAPRRKHPRRCRAGTVNPFR